MTALGKLAPEQFARLIAPHLGAARPEVLQGPRVGTDAAIVRLGAGRVMAVTTDPLSLIPGLGPEDSARLAAHLLASDLWTTGIPPAYAAVSLQLPPALDDEVLGRYWRTLASEWAKLEVAVVTGHTGRYEGCDLTIVGAATLIGTGDEGRTVGPAFVRPGDRVLVTKGCAIEATAIAARLFPERLAARLEPEVMERARGMLDQVSVVRDCRAALRVGVRDRGVSALHDATEGGVLGALVELALACSLDLRIERARIPLEPAARAACELLDIDPHRALSEGTLIAAVRPETAAAVRSALEEEGIPCADAGEVVRGPGAVWLTEADGKVAELRQVEPDPWWPAYARAVREGWR
jgi:hydrogenase expression/formation protein HypE